MPEAAYAGIDINKATAHLIRAWNRHVLSYRWSVGLLLLTVAAFCIARAYAALIASENFTTDAFMIFDGAWRLVNGQRPHTDFYSHLGVLTYLPEAAGLWIARGTAYSFGYSQALVAWFLGIWAFLLARRRLGDIPTVLFTVGIVLVAVAPFAPGFPPFNFGAGMVYNRWGYALLALIFIEGFGGRKRLTKSDELWGGLSSGAVLVVSFFLKITVFAAALLLLAALIPRRRQPRIRLIAILTSAFVFVLPFLFYFGFHVGPLLQDLITVARAKHIPWRSYQLDGTVQDVMLVAVLAITASFVAAENGDKRRVLSTMLAAVAISLASLAMLFGDHEYSGFPLAAFFAIVVCDGIDRPCSEASGNNLRAAVLLVGAVSICGVFSGCLAGLSYGVLERLRGEPQSAHLSTPVWSGFSFTKDDRGFADFFNDGFMLLRRNRREGETVLPLYNSNPFSYGLGIKPSRGGAAFLQYRTTFSDNSRPSPEWLVGQSDLILVPIGLEERSTNPGMQAYMPYIKTHYREIAQGRFWRLFRRWPELR